MTTSDATKPDIYTRITNQIIASSERGVKPWKGRRKSLSCCPSNIPSLTKTVLVGMR